MTKFFSDDKYKFIYIHVPKTGGTSVKKILNDKIDIDGWKIDGEFVRYDKHTHTKIDAKWHSEYKDYFKFSFVRHPYEWIMSYYNFGRNKHQFYKRAINFHTKNSINVDFDSWLKSKNRMNQTDFFSESGTILVDRVCKLENFEDEMKSILLLLGLDQDFEPTHLKNSNSFGIQTIKTLNETQKSFVRKICQQDFDLLGYDA